MERNITAHVTGWCSKPQAAKQRESAVTVRLTSANTFRIKFTTEDPAGNEQIIWATFGHADAQGLLEQLAEVIG